MGACMKNKKNDNPKNNVEEISKIATVQNNSNTVKNNETDDRKENNIDNNVKTITTQNNLNIVTKNNAIKNYYEKDNLGSRYLTESDAFAFWIPRLTKKKPSYLFAYFKNKEICIQCFLQFPDFFAIAQDTNELISLKILEFGYYFCDSVKKYECFVFGDTFTEKNYDLFEKFVNQNGEIKNREINTEKIQNTILGNTNQNKNSVTFSHIEKNNSLGSVYHIYKGNSQKAAEDFLKDKIVNQSLFYYVVETPEGNFCKDIQGFYQE